MVPYFAAGGALFFPGPRHEHPDHAYYRGEEGGGLGMVPYFAAGFFLFARPQA